MKAATSADILDWIQSNFGYLVVDHPPPAVSDEVPLQPRPSRKAAHKRLRQQSTPYQRLFGSERLKIVLEDMTATSPVVHRKIQVGIYLMC